MVLTFHKKSVKKGDKDIVVNYDLIFGDQDKQSVISKKSGPDAQNQINLQDMLLFHMIDRKDLIVID
jgi:hypothetical protein